LPTPGPRDSGRPPATDFRRATTADAEALRDLERAANLASLAHVFAPDTFPYPHEEVLERWRRTLVEAERGVGVGVEVVDTPEGLRAFAAYDDTTLRHLAVHPDHWGSGLARAAVDRATVAIAARGAERAVLWCLEVNDRARGLYAHLGWRRTGRSRAAQWAPYPTEVELFLSLGRTEPERVPWR